MIGHVVLVMLAVMTLKQMAATMKVLAQIRVPMPVNKLATLQDAEAMLYAKWCGPVDTHLWCAQSARGYSTDVTT